jgi:hypothetical protein
MGKQRLRKASSKCKSMMLVSLLDHTTWPLVQTVRAPKSALLRNSQSHLRKVPFRCRIHPSKMKAAAASATRYSEARPNVQLGQESNASLASAALLATWRTAKTNSQQQLPNRLDETTCDCNDALNKASLAPSGNLESQPWRRLKVPAAVRQHAGLTDDDMADI